MKKLLTLLLICVAATGWGQNVFKYPTVFKNDVYIEDSVQGSPTSSPVFEIRTDSTIFTAFGGDGTKTLIVTNTGLLDTTSSSGGVAEPATQIVYGTGAGVTSDANHTIDATTGAFVSTASTATESGTLGVQPSVFSLNATTANTGGTSQFEGDTQYVAMFWFNGIDTTYSLRVGRSGGAFTSGNDGIVFKSADGTYARMPDNLFGTSGQVLTTDGAGQTHWGYGLSGVYLPDTSDGADITDFTIDSASYIRVGQVVTVTGYISDISTGISGGTIQLSLPIASNIARVGQLTGTVNIDDAVAGGGSYILGHVANDKAVLTTPPVALSNALLTFAFSYLVY